jgi:hypothetical protein
VGLARGGRKFNIFLEGSQALPASPSDRVGFEIILFKRSCRYGEVRVNCGILATCRSTYSPVRTSQEAHSVSIK